ncbi:MAG: protein-glutamate methylesterase/protein-glutamine glutaminase [Candidatus Binatia bacterium]
MIDKKSNSLSVLVVDDSAVMREAVTAVLSQEPGITVTTAPDPMIALIKIRRQRPDVILLDLEMPRMGGIAFLRKIMRENPIPVLVCSAHVGAGAVLGIEALAAGAVDVVAKPQIGVREFLHESAVALIDAVRAAARANMHRHAKIPRVGPMLGADAVLPLDPEPLPGRGSDKVIAIGASTGGTEALRLVLEAMPQDAPGLVIVQHMPQGFTAAFAARLNASCRIEVKEATGRDLVANGRALIAPGNRHMLVRRGACYYADVVDGPLVSRHRPSVDMLFRSVADVAGANGVGVIMTGMGTDGAQGLLEMKHAGAFTIAQDEQSCIIFGMPKEAIDRGAVCRIAALQHIPSMMLQTLSSGRPPAGRT